MDSSYIEKHHVLLIDSRVSFRRTLGQLFEKAGVAEMVVEAHSIVEGRKLLHDGNFSLCLVGNGLSSETQKNFIESIRREKLPHPCALIALCSNPDTKTVLEFVNAGAHGVVKSLPEIDTLRKVVRIAYQKCQQAHPNDKNN